MYVMYACYKIPFVCRYARPNLTLGVLSINTRNTVVAHHYDCSSIVNACMLVKTEVHTTKQRSQWLYVVVLKCPECVYQPAYTTTENGLHFNYRYYSDDGTLCTDQRKVKRTRCVIPFSIHSVFRRRDASHPTNHRRMDVFHYYYCCT